MNASPLARLLGVAGPSIGGTATELPAAIGELAGPLATELSSLLEKKNGFYAFEAALHVFPDKSLRSEHGLETWNSSQLWISSYGGLGDGCLFFAEDVFGGQFCITAGGIATFDPETGERQPMASSFAEWATAILADYEVLTGYPLAHEWQKLNGAIPSGKRLIPKQPFVLGGEYSLANLYLQDSVMGMRSRGDLARQIHDQPDGSQVRFKIIE